MVWAWGVDVEVGVDDERECVGVVAVVLNPEFPDVSPGDTLANAENVCGCLGGTYFLFDLVAAEVEEGEPEGRMVTVP